MYVFVIQEIETETDQSNGTCVAKWMTEYTKVEEWYKIRAQRIRSSILIIETIYSNHYV
jgi:hypothetical protein